MHQTAATTQVISKSYLSGLILKCGLFFAGGLLLTGVALYFSNYQPLGPSYQESFARLSQLKEEMLVKSITIYCLLTTLVAAGVIFTTMTYSHRVVGPLVGIKRVVKAIAAGDLTQPARLRQKDAIKPMAEALNALRDTYKTHMTVINQQAKVMDELFNQQGGASQAKAIIDQAKVIKDAMAHLHLR